MELDGFPCTCLADGTELNHEPDERISAQDLEMMLDIAITLLDEAALELGGGWPADAGRGRRRRTAAPREPCRS